MAEHLEAALEFSQAIDSRGYLSDPEEEPTTEPAVLRRLRFLARYIVVSLLLERVDLAATLVQRLAAATAAYQAVAADAVEWRQTVVDATAFVEVRGQPKRSRPR